MKRALWLLCLMIVLSGCGKSEGELDRAMTLRSKLLAGQGAAFDVKITADYGDKTYTFGMHCQGDTQGNVEFMVVEPKSLEGISGTIASGAGKLTFDHHALAFELLADGQVSPVSAPWFLHKALCSGYITSTVQEGEQLRLAIDDSYREDALHLDIWLGDSELPVRGEILWQGRRIVSMEISNFEIL